MISRTACFNTLPDAFVGMGVCCAKMILGTINDDRPVSVQARLTDATDKLPASSSPLPFSSLSLHLTCFFKLNKALTSSPSLTCGRPTTAAAATPGICACHAAVKLQADTIMLFSR